MKQKILTLNSHVLAPKSKDGGIAQGGWGGHFLIKGKKRLENKVSRLKSYYCNNKMLIRWGP